MIWLILLALAAIIGCWIVFPEFRVVVDGWKTRVTGWIIVLMGVVEQIDEQLLSQALGLDTKGKAWLFLGLGVSVLVFRELTKKPGALARRK